MDANSSYVCAAGWVLPSWAAAAATGDWVGASNKKKGLEGVAFQWEKSEGTEQKAVTTGYSRISF